jgi:hypothetical protein
VETYKKEEDREREVNEELVKWLQCWNGAYKYLQLLIHHQPQAHLESILSFNINVELLIVALLLAGSFLLPKCAIHLSTDTILRHELLIITHC